MILASLSPKMVTILIIIDLIEVDECSPIGAIIVVQALEASDISPISSLVIWHLLLAIREGINVRDLAHLGVGTESHQPQLPVLQTI